jgi:hypothetical protein
MLLLVRCPMPVAASHRRTVPSEDHNRMRLPLRGTARYRLRPIDPTGRPVAEAEKLLADFGAELPVELTSFVAAARNRARMRQRLVAAAAIIFFMLAIAAAFLDCRTDSDPNISQWRAAMYPLDSIYGHKAYKGFLRGEEGSLKRYKQSSGGVGDGGFLHAGTYAKLVDIVSFLSVMNKRHTLHFRGQGQPLRPLPALFRSTWTSLSGTRHEISYNIRQRLWDLLNNDISALVCSICSKMPMPRPATLRLFREAAWAIAQHYELWPTPLIDITPSLRTAASFALWGGRAEGYLYVLAMPPSTNSITFDADQHVVLARLHAVCPPVAKRPHFQEGYLVGRFPFDPERERESDRDFRYFAKVSNLERRLIAKIRLTDTDEKQHRRDATATGQGFWSKDFPRMSEKALMPEVLEDPLLASFREKAADIDRMMRMTCSKL